MKCVISMLEFTFSERFSIVNSNDSPTYIQKKIQKSSTDIPSHNVSSFFPLKSPTHKNALYKSQITRKQQ